MTDEQLRWTVSQRSLLLHTPVFDVTAQQETSGTGLTGTYVAMEAPDWVMTVPVYQNRFVLVRQWRHASEQLSMEFPGGVADPKEDPAVTARRELLEETGFEAGRLTLLGSCSPNPALFKNRFFCYLAEDLRPTGKQHLDADELLNCQLLPIETVVEAFGSPEYGHALMGTALAFYLRHRAAERNAKEVRP